MDSQDKDCIINLLLNEMQAIKMYNKVVEITENEKVKQYFELFAANEQGHLTGLRELAGKYFSSEQLEEMNNKIQELEGKEVELSHVLENVLKEALEAEEKQEKSYTECASFVKQEDAKKMYYAFAENEKLHVELIKKMILEITTQGEENEIACKSCGEKFMGQIDLCPECAKKELEKQLE